MRNRPSLPIVALCLLTLSSARVSAQGTAEARKSYDAAIREAKQSFLKCDAEKMAGVTEDYTGVNADGHVTKGRAAELKEDRDFCAANTVTAWDVTTEDFHSSGPLAWAAGVLSMTWKSKTTGKVSREQGRYLATYVRQPDGKWLQQYFMAVPIKAARQ